MQYKCQKCEDTGSISKHLSGSPDCASCDVATERLAMENFLDKLPAMSDYDAAWLVHQRALAMAPKQEAPRQWVAIKDSAWVNIVNHDYAYDGWDKDDIINHVFKLTEAKCKELNGPDAAPAAANGALTDEQILTIIWKYSSFISVGNYSSTQFDCQTDMLNCIRAILAAAGSDAALPDGYVMVPINPTQKMIEASITGSGDRVDGISLARFARAHKAMISALHDTPQASAMDDITKDAERYRWLRDCDWFSSELCVLRDPKQVLTKTGLTLGADCPSRFRLDEAIDKARAALSGAKGN